MRTGIRLITALACAVLAYGQDQPQWKDQAEFDLYTAATKEADPQKKVALLDQWKAKYPESGYVSNRVTAYLQAYQQLKDNPKVLDALNQLAALNPKNTDLRKGTMLFIMQTNDASAPFLTTGEKMANESLTGPHAALAHTMLGWVAMQRKDNDAAEKEFRESLKVQADAPEVNAWLANLLYKRKDVPQALFFYARAKYDEYTAKLYTAFHGADEAGLAELKAAAAAGAFPPAGFTIKSKRELEDAASQDWDAKHPAEVLWRNLKAALTAADGAAYFEANMKGADVPGGANGVQSFQGVVVSAKPLLKPKELVVALFDGKTAEVTVKLEVALAAKVDAGTPVEFSGVPESFTAAPYMVTFTAAKDKVKLGKK